MGIGSLKASWSEFLVAQPKRYFVKHSLHGYGTTALSEACAFYCNPHPRALGSPGAPPAGQTFELFQMCFVDTLCI